MCLYLGFVACYVVDWFGVDCGLLFVLYLRCARVCRLGLLPLVLFWVWVVCLFGVGMCLP